MQLFLRRSLLTLGFILGLLFYGGVFFLIWNITHEKETISLNTAVPTPPSANVVEMGTTSVDTPPKEETFSEKFFPRIISGILPSSKKNISNEVSVAKQEGEPDAIIFGEHLGSGWQDNSWGVKYKEETSPTTPQNYISITYAKPWDGLSFYSKGFLVSGYNELVFKVNFDKATTTDTYVSLYNGKQKSESLALKNYIDAGRILPNVWYEVHIPLADFTLTNPSVTQITIESGKYETLSFARIGFALNKEVQVGRLSNLAATFLLQGSSSTVVEVTNSPKVTLRDNPFLSGWTMDTWGSEINEVADSGGVMRVQFLKPWGTLIFWNDKNIDIRSADTLQFILSDDLNSNAKLYVIAYNPKGEKLGTIFLNDFIPNKKIPVHAYQEVFLPLLKLDPALQSVGRIDIQAEDSTGLILIKKIGFIRLAEVPHGTVPTSQIYMGGFRNKWSYDTTDVIANPSSVKRSFVGDYSIQLNFTTPWSSFSIIYPGGFSTEGYHALSFMLYGGETGGQEFYLTGFDKEGKKLGTQYLMVNTSNGRIPPLTWVNVVIPLSAIDGGESVLGSVKLESAAPTEDVWLDDIKFLEN